MRLTTIIFDLDGTLADTRRAILEAFRRTVNALGISLRRYPTDIELITIPLDASFRNAGVSDPRRMSEVLDHYDREFRKTAAQKVRPFPGVLETIDILSRTDLRLAIATNETRENLDHVLSVFGIFGKIDASICSDEVAAPKPATDMVDHLMARLGTSPRDTLVVGDSEFDLKMGKAAGCATCAVSYGAHTVARLRRCRPDWMIDAFAQLLAIEPVAEALIVPKLPKMS
jgi:phosphoglycolate phosphatase